MDILKLLSRSTKPTNKSSTGTNAGKIPSAGTSENPQLFHDAAHEARGKKRKRGDGKLGAQTPEQKEEDDGEAIDFFSTKSAGPVAQSKGTSPKARTKAKPVPAKTAAPILAELLDEGECRQILRSHRLKVTLLSSNKPFEKQVKKSKKNKVSKQEVAKKPEFIQIYPQPLTNFSELRSKYGISGRMADNLAQQGYKIPTEVQMGSLPLLLQPKVALGEANGQGVFDTSENVNLLSVAPTGSGKTLAFLIPVVNEVMQRRRKTEEKGGHCLDAIIVAPTKELASQIVNEAKKLSLGTGIKVVGMKKGMSVVGHQNSEDAESSGDSEEEPEAENEKPGKKTLQPVAKADILVTTPGLLLSAVTVGDGHIPLPTVKTLVLDEADVLLDPLFRDQTLGIWSSCISPKLRVTLWSATMGSNIESLASSTIQARQARLGLENESRTVRLVVGLKDSAIPNITHRLVYAATEPGKLLALRQLLHPTAKTNDSVKSLRPPFLVFTQTIPRAIALHSELLYDIPAEAGGSSRIAVLHSNLSDSARDHVMTRFRNGEVWILITTDILSRGVDFRGINGVVNYDVPNSGAAYIHRVGRTGRAGRDGGVAVTFYTKEDVPYVKNIANIIAVSEKQAGLPPSEASMQKWFLDALPNPTKEEKKNLKKHGVEARRGGLGKSDGKDGRGKGKMLISTKSGYERKLQHNRRGAIEGSKRRGLVEAEVGPDAGAESEWGGIDE